MITLTPNQIIGSYRITRPLGEGGMATVYEVEHTKLGVHYALKTFTLQEGHVELFRKRFSVEGKILARLNHPNLVRVIDLDVDETLGVLYYVMDLVLYSDGETHTLADIKPGEADETQIYEWFRQMCDAVAYVHEQGIVHRDIKLNNILLAPDGHVVLSDFGISRVFDEKMRSDVNIEKTIVTGMTESGHLAMGTQGYMAPEILRGEEATPAADVYSLGVAFFRLLTNVWYDPCLAPKNDSADTIGMNSVKLLEPFDYRWVDALPLMLNENPSDRPTKLTELPARLPPPVAESPQRIRLWLVLSLLAAGIAILLVARALFNQDEPDRRVNTNGLYDVPSAFQEK